MSPGSEAQEPGSRRFRQVEALFQAALEVPTRELPHWLDDACGGDDALRAEVAQLIAAHEEATGFLEPPTEGSGLQSAEPGSLRLGAYRLLHPLQPLGEGGSSTVYLGVRADDSYQQRVAIKVLRHSVGGGDGAHRFRRERQILAGLDHPNIARLLDGGTTPEGSPYLVMEYIEGLPIDRYCEERELALEDRLALFLRVLGAVQFAHQSLVVHRDLKPSNILVRPDGEPKLLDFGIAKFLNPELSGQLDPTRADLLLLTPNYASPEQLQGRPVTTASDVYSLGVLLFRLLTGRLPQEIGIGSSLQEIVEVVCKEEAPLASSVSPGERSSAVRRALKGDLDRILATALAKKGEERYPTAAALGEDLRRYLAGEPISVRSGSPMYRLKKGLVRYRWRMAAALAFLGVLLVFLGQTVVQNRRVTLAWNKAEREHRRAEAINDFLRATLVEASPYGATLAWQAPTVAEAMKAAAESVDEELAEQPEVALAVRNVIGNALDGLGDYEAAERFLRQALAQQVEVVVVTPDDLPPVADLPATQDLQTTLNHLGLVAYHQGDAEAAEGWLRTAWALMLRSQPNVPPVHRATVAQNLGLVLKHRGHGSEAEALLLEARTLLRGEPGRRAARDAAIVLGNLATLYNSQGQYAQAAAMLRQGIEEGRQLYGDDHIQVGDALHNLGFSLYSLGRYAEAEATFERALEVRGRALGEDHPALVDTYHMLGAVARNRGRYDRAAQWARDTLDLRRRAAGAAHPRLVVDLHLLGSILCQAGRTEAAAPPLEEARQLLAAQSELRPTWRATNLSLRARVLLARGDLSEAWRLSEEGLAMRLAELGPNHLAVGLSRMQLGEVAAARGDLPEALREFEAAVEILAAATGEGSAEALRARLWEGRTLATLRRSREAEERLAVVVRDPPELLLQHPVLRHDYLQTLVQFYEEMGRGAEAAPLRAELAQWDAAVER